MFSLLKPTFSLLGSPHLLPLMLHPTQNAPLPQSPVHSFGIWLSPVHFRRRSAWPV